MDERDLLNIKFRAEIELLGAVAKVMFMMHPERDAVERLVRTYLEGRSTTALYASMTDEEAAVAEHAAQALAELILSRSDLDS